MIELKPYRSIEVSKDLKKEGKSRLAGRIQTGHSVWRQGGPENLLMFSLFLFMAVMLGVSCKLVTLPIQVGVIAPCFLIPVILIVGFTIWYVIAEIIEHLWVKHFSDYIKQPTLLISHDHVTRGEAIDIVFCLPIPPEHIVDFSIIEILFREIVSYPSDQHKSGTGIDTYNTILKREQVFDGLISADRMYEHRLTYTLPRDIMHSFALANNSLVWLIRITLAYKGFTSLTETYAFEVTPEIHTL